jgi:DNA helicase-2/ATP-dependent DNA helicase PcrA
MTTYTPHEIAALLGLPGPTAEQTAVIEAPLEPVLVVAGAGSGKTETMSARVVYLVANGLVEPDEVLGLTFTRKAAGELAERIRRRLRTLAARLRADGVAHSLEEGVVEAMRRPTVSTYNSYAAGLVKEHALRLGIEPSARLLGEASGWQLAHEVVESWTGELQTGAAVSTIVNAVRELSGALSEHLLTPADARARMQEIIDAIEATPAGNGRSEHLAPVKALLNLMRERIELVDLVAELARRKRVSEALDFGDQVALGARLAEEFSAVGELERARYRVVLLDEYQDTSFAQARMLGALFGAGHAVTAVGDPNQSIYGWRGASASGLSRFAEQFSR